MQIINKLLRLLKVYIFFISFVLFIIIFSTTYLKANTFKVTDIEISSPFELNFKKNTVIDKGFRTSFLNLLSMITTSGDKNKINKISMKEIKSMIDSFTISNERFVNNEYFAKLETSFNKKKILNFLEKRNIFPSMAIKNKVLLVPILVDTETENIYLFNNNLFYKNWNNIKENYQLLEYLLPNEDLEDLKDIQKAQEINLKLSLLFIQLFSIYYNNLGSIFIIFFISLVVIYLNLNSYDNLLLPCLHMDQIHSLHLYMCLSYFLSIIRV